MIITEGHNPNSPWTEAQFDAVATFIEKAKPYLELRDWRFLLMDDHPDDDKAAASVLQVEGRKLVELRLARDFFTDEFSDKQRTHFLIHEMCHLFTFGLDHTFEKTGKDWLPANTYDALCEIWNNQVEILTDTLAYAFADLLPFQFASPGPAATEPPAEDPPSAEEHHA